MYNATMHRERLDRVTLGEGASMYSPEVMGDAAWRARYQRDALSQTDRFVLASAVETLLYMLSQDHGVEYLKSVRRILGAHRQSGPAR